MIHVYSEYANKILDWFPTDSEELYQKNLIERYDDLKKYKWIDKKFTYKFNSHGFRCDEFTDEPTLMVLGCSYTCGIGLPIENIWPEIVAKKLNLKCANFGIGGAGPDLAFRLCLEWIDKIKPKLLIYSETFPCRIELLHDKTFSMNLCLSDLTVNDSGLMRKIKNFYSMWSDDERNYLLNYEKNKLAIKHLCHERNIKMIETSIEGTSTTSFHHIMNSDDKARDLIHPGIKSNYNFSMKLLEII